MARGTRRRGPIHARIVLAIWLGMDDDIDVARVGLAASRASRRRSRAVRIASASPRD
jgi:hypothetical protein